MKRIVIIASLLFVIFQTGHTQNTYQVLFASGLDDVVHYISKGDNGEYVVIKYKNYWGGMQDTSQVVQYKIYSFFNDLQDSLCWPVSFNRLDTTILPHIVYYDSSFYYVFGAAVFKTGQSDTSIIRNDYMAKFDSDKQIVWERFYPRSPEFNDYCNAFDMNILLLTSGNFFTVVGVPKIGSPEAEWLLREFTKNGEVVKTRVFSDYLSGYVQSLTYSFDSSEILIHSTTGRIPGCNNLYTAGRGAVILDTVSYDTVGGICYAPDINIEYPYEAAFDKNGHLLLAGNYWSFDFEHHVMKEYIAVSVLNSDFQVINSKILSDIDRRAWAGERKCMDIDANGNIYIAGVVDWVPDFWPTTYDYIYVAKLDSNLNLITERYFGGDLFYHVMSMLSTTDGGIILGGMQYDYTINNYEQDAFVIKTNAGLWVGTPAGNTIPVHSALVYPNPGNGTFKIRTTEKGSLFMLYNLSGKLLLQTEIKDLVTQQDANRLANGVYVWKLFKNNREIDSGKWINIK